MRKQLFAGAAVIALVAGSAHAQELMVQPGDGPFNWDSYNAFAADHDYSGQTVSMTGPWTGEDDKLVRNVLAYFEAATGATVDYSGSDSFEQDIVISAQANSAPNVAVFPQPGLASDMAARGFLAPLGTETSDWIRGNYAAGDSWVSLGTYKDGDGNAAFFGFPYKIDVKSLVWYVPEQFEENGYEVPESMEELKELTETIAADGATPWCIGLGSGAATGWPATDWVEDLLLRTQPPEVYDQWVTNEIPFDDPRIIAAIEEFGYFAKNDDHVAGGMEAVPNTDFRDSPQGLFELPPECYMHHQATFIPTFFPDDTELGVDVDFFYFPAYESKDLGKPVLGAGTLFAILDDTPAARGFIEFLKTPIAHELWMSQGGFLTPYKGVNAEAYENDTLRALGDILLNATTFRFDGSDLMPGEIGAGAFWTGMVDYTSGSEAGDVAEAIQNRWNSMQ